MRRLHDAKECGMFGSPEMVIEALGSLGGHIADVAKRLGENEPKALHNECVGVLHRASQVDREVRSMIQNLAFASPTEGISTLVFSHCWTQLGRPIFRLTADLLAAMLVTECGGVSMDEVQLPFGALVLQVPPLLSTLGWDNQREFVRTILVHRFRAVRAGSQTTMEEYIRADGPQEERIFLALIGERGASAWALQGFAGDGDAETWLGTLDSGFYEHRFGMPSDETDERTVAAAWRMVVNLALYTSARTLPAPDRPKRKVTKRGKRTAKYLDRVYRIGHEIKLPAALHSAARDYVESGSKPAAWRASRRFVVRGHFRNQAVGKGRLERKRIWIQPFWKGPTSADELERRYVVEKPTKE
jgi:hypothetical protein